MTPERRNDSELMGFDTPTRAQPQSHSFDEFPMFIMTERLGEDIRNHVIRRNIPDYSLSFCHKVVPEEMILPLDVFCPGSELRIPAKNDGSLVVTV